LPQENSKSKWSIFELNNMVFYRHINHVANSNKYAKDWLLGGGTHKESR